MSKSDKKTGTLEWANKTINIAAGCEHNCRYCYAREMLVDRFKTIKAEDWKAMKVDFEKVNQNRPKYDGVVMMFSSHDWTPSIINDSIAVLKRVLDAGNNVLIVTKPHWSVITVLCNVITEYKQQVEFRFTIGSTRNEVLQFWERNAPLFEERIACLQYAFEHGYRTSVSCEPFLDGRVNNVYNACIQYITESFWIGMLNKFDQRCQLDDITPDEKIAFVDPLRECLETSGLRAVYFEMRNRDKVRWKDTFQSFIETVARPMQMRRIRERRI